MKNFLKYIVKKMIAFSLHFFWIFPIQTNKIIFINDHSYTYSDNLKYLAEFFVKESPKKYDIFFSLKEDAGLDNIMIKPVAFLSLKHFYHSLTAGTVITNDSGIVYLPIRKKQLVINTWHGGGPYKVTGIGALDNYWYRKDLQYNASKVDYFLSSCKACTDEEARGMFYKTEQCINCGMPRIDIFFDDNAVRNTRSKVFDFYKIPDTDKLVLYAPTFRGFIESYEGVMDNNLLEIDHNNLVKSLEIRFGGTWHFSVRLHPKLKNIPINDTSILNMSLYPDAEELLLSADVLITDYSSVMWDFSFSKKPCFIFATDIDDYDVKRGFYCQPEEWPYPIAETNEQLYDNIMKFDYENYWMNLSEHHRQSESYEKGNSREIVKQVVDKHIEELG